MILIKASRSSHAGGLGEFLTLGELLGRDRTLGRENFFQAALLGLRLAGASERRVVFLFATRIGQAQQRLGQLGVQFMRFGSRFSGVVLPQVGS